MRYLAILRSSPVEPPKEADLDADGSPGTISLVGRRALIVSGSNPVWISPEAWQVRSASLLDLNHDRQWEAPLLVWRPFQPWPIDRFLPYGGRINEFHNVDGFSCHPITANPKETRGRRSSKQQERYNSRKEAVY